MNGLLRLLFAFCFSIVVSVIHAQPDLSPWTAKFIVTHPNGIDSDTVWFGCDTAGGPGYQPGLDIIDTNFNGRIRILAYDEKVEADSGFGTCVNLRRDIKEFHEIGSQIFTVYILSDSSGAGFNTSLTWDTSELYFRNSSFKLTGLWIESTYGYIEAIDGTDYGICGHFVGDTTIICDANVVAIIADGIAFECNKSSPIVRIDIHVWFNQYFTGIGNRSDPKDSRISLFPNPTTSMLHYDIQSEFSGGYATIYDSKGLPVSRNAIQGTSGFLDIDFLERGSYFLLITNDQFTTSYRGTFIKL